MTPSLDDAFRALVHPERRRLLLALADHNPRPDHSFDCVDDVRFDSSENMEDIQLRMHHLHLPMLEAAGFIERLDEDREITIGRNFAEIRPLLQFVEQETDRVGAVYAL